MAAQYQNELLNRIADLESRFAFQEDTIETLNQLLTQQAEELANMQRKMQLLIEKFQQMSEQRHDNPINPADEIPPHY